MKNISKKLYEITLGLIAFVTKYRITLFIIVIGALLSVMLIDISIMSDASPSDQQISEAESSVKVIVFKEESIKVINSLKANDIQIETLFDPNRYDPFNN